MLASMNWRRGFLLAAINLAVAIPFILWAESQDANFVRQHYVPAAQVTESSSTATDQTSGEKDEGIKFSICSMTDQNSVQEQVVILTNMPAQILIGWRVFCPAKWELAGMLHADGWAPSPSSLAAQRKVDIVFVFVIAVQWFFVGAFPLRRPKRSLANPEVFITTCAVLAGGLAIIHPVEGLARLPALCGVFAWFWWFGLLLWTSVRGLRRWMVHRSASQSA
jgi:hypothetical protein